MAFEVDFVPDDTKKPLVVATVYEDDFSGLVDMTVPGGQAIVVMYHEDPSLEGVGNMFAIPLVPGVAQLRRLRGGDAGITLDEIEFDKRVYLSRIPAGWSFEHHIVTEKGWIGNLVVRHRIDEGEIFIDPHIDTLGFDIPVDTPYAAN